MCRHAHLTAAGSNSDQGVKSVSIITTSSERLWAARCTRLQWRLTGLTGSKSVSLFYN